MASEVAGRNAAESLIFFQNRPSRALASAGPSSMPEASSTALTAPALAPIGHDRFLLAWVDGDVESNRLRAQSVVGWGDPVGPAMVLSPSDATIIGHPSVAIEPSGYGVVTYIASVQGEFDVLATPIACAMN